MNDEDDSDDLFELTPEEEELFLECSRLSLADLLDKGLDLFADQVGGLFEFPEPSPT